MPGRVEIVRAVVPYYFQSPYSSGISSARESAIGGGWRKLILVLTRSLQHAGVRDGLVESRS
jgi:hypothetical protein